MYANYGLIDLAPTPSTHNKLIHITIIVSARIICAANNAVPTDFEWLQTHNCQFQVQSQSGTLIYYR